MSKYFTLSNGNKIPFVGYGTGTKWFKADNPDVVDEKTVDALLLALESGQYHIDTAEIYNTHLEVATALKRFQEKHPDFKRSDLWITDKFFAKNQSPLKTVTETLKLLNLEYLDLYLIHSPFFEKTGAEKTTTLELVWKEIEELYEQGKVKNIGVSNFRVSDLEELFKIAKVQPVVNQIEYNALLQEQSPGIVEFSQKHDILVEAYSPLGPLYKTKGDATYVKLDAEIEKLAAKYKKTTGEILLRWTIQNKVLPVTTSAKKQRIIESISVYDFELSPEDQKAITDIGKLLPPVRQYWEGFY